MKRITRIISLALAMMLMMTAVPALADGPDKVVMTFLTAGVEPTDLGLVQDAVNEITIPEINVEIEFKPVSVFTAPSQYSMWIGARETIDIMIIAFTDIKPFIDMGIIDPLNDWIDQEGDYLKEFAESHPLFREDAEGNIWGMATMPTALGRGGGVLINVEHLEAAGLADQYHDMQKITLDELGEIYAAIKKALPDVYPCGNFGSLPASGYTMFYDSLGASRASGVLLSKDSTEVANYYTSDAYKDYLAHVRDWYLKGYIMKDAATSEAKLNDLTAAGVISSNFTEGTQSLLNDSIKISQKPYIRLMFNDYYMPSISSGEFPYATVPVTSQNPEAAIRFLNLLYQSADLENLLIYGIEGKHWVYLDKEAGVVTYPEGVTATNTGYAYGYGFYGDQTLLVTFGSSTIEGDTYQNETAWANRSIGYGFMFDSTDYSDMITNVQGVINEYVPALETGSAELDTIYPEFVAKLEAAGINTLIAAKQAQFDEWLASQK